MSTEATKLAQIAKDNPAGWLALWDSVQALVALWAWRFIRRGGGSCLFDIDDLKQAGFLAMVASLDAFDETKGAFSTYLGFRVRTAFQEVAGKRRKRIDTISLDSPVGDTDDLTLADTIPDPAAEFEYGVIEGIAAKQDFHMIQQEFHRLTEQEQQVITECVIGTRTLTGLAEEWGLTRQRVQAIRESALTKLRRLPVVQRLGEYRIRHVTFAEFKHTWTSSPEWAVIEKERNQQREWEQQRAFARSRSEKIDRFMRERGLLKGVE